MATQTLDTVQRKFVNETARFFLEQLIRVRDELDTFILDYDNQQNAIATTADDLGDGTDGTAPRGDAPVLTGTQLGQLRTFAGDLKAQIPDNVLDILVSLAVRDVKTILRRNR